MKSVYGQYMKMCIWKVYVESIWKSLIDMDKIGNLVQLTLQALSVSYNMLVECTPWAVREWQVTLCHSLYIQCLYNQSMPIWELWPNHARFHLQLYQIWAIWGGYKCNLKHIILLSEIGVSLLLEFSSYKGILNKLSPYTVVIVCRRGCLLA